MTRRRESREVERIAPLAPPASSTSARLAFCFFYRSNELYTTMYVLSCSFSRFRTPR